MSNPPRRPPACAKPTPGAARTARALGRLAASASSLIGLFLIGTAACFAQADYAREQRWADEIVPGIIVGDAVELALKSGRRFLTIYAPGRKAGVLIVHGMGVHPDWGLINPLRSRLAEQGYATLSVQMPVLAADARGEQYPPLYPEAAERLAVASAFLRDRGHLKVAIVSHSKGARMANFFLNLAPQPQIDAWVAIGLSGAFTEPQALRFPVLDVFGENDLPAVLGGAAQRAEALRRVRGAAQIRVGGADHFFQGHEAELVRQVRQFLDAKLR